MASTSRQALIEEAVLSTVQGLSLSGMPAANIVRMLDAKLDEAAKGELPRIVVTHTGQTETMDPKAGTNASDDITHPVRVYMLAATNKDQTAGNSGDQYLLWRQQIAAAFHNRRLSVSGIDAFQCVVVPLQIHSTEAWAANLWLSGFTIQVTCRVSRS